MKFKGTYHEKNGFCVYLKKKNGKMIAPFVMVSLKDMWWLPKKRFISNNKLVYGWLFFYFGIVYIGGRD